MIKNKQSASLIVKAKPVNYEDCAFDDAYQVSDIIAERKSYEKVIADLKTRADKLQKLYSEVDERNFKLFEKEKKRADAFRNVNTRYKNKIMKLDKLSTEIDKERAKQFQRAEKAEAKLNSIADELERIAINYDGDELIDKLEELAKELRENEK